MAHAVNNSPAKMHIILPLGIILLSQSIAPYSFSKRGSASKSWGVSAETSGLEYPSEYQPQNFKLGQNWNKGDQSKENPFGTYAKDGKKSLKSKYSKASQYQQQVSAQVGSAQEMALQSGMSAAAQAQGKISLTVHRGSESVAAAAGSATHEMAVKSGESFASVHEMEQSMTVLPMDPESDTAVIVIHKSNGLRTEGVLDSFAVDAAHPTRGHIFQKDSESQCEEEEEEGGDEKWLEVPVDAASFVITQPGPQLVELSHEMIVDSGRELFIVLELPKDESENSYVKAKKMFTGSARSSVSSSSSGDKECPFKIFNDKSAEMLRFPREYSPLLETDIIAEILSAVFDKDSGKYKLIMSTFDKPHKLAMSETLHIGWINLSGKDASNVLVTKSAFGGENYQIMYDPLRESELDTEVGLLNQQKRAE